MIFLKVTSLMLKIILQFQWTHICELNCTSKPTLSLNIGEMKTWATEYSHTLEMPQIVTAILIMLI